MSLICRIFALLMLFAAYACAANVQVIEGDSRGPHDLSAKKLKAMARVYLAELGHVPSLLIQNLGVTFSSSGPDMHFIRMQKFLPDGQVENDSATVSDVNDVDEAVEFMLTKSFGYASKTFKSERLSKVFLEDPVIIDVEDGRASLASKKAELAIEQLGYELSDNYGKASLKMFFVKLKDFYWLGMIRTEGSKVVKGVHTKFSSDRDLESIIFTLTRMVMDTSVEPVDSNTEVVNYADTHEARCRATDDVNSVGGFFIGLTFDILCYLSDYVGLEIAAGGKDLYSKWYPNLRFDFVWGFTDYHSWLLGLDYAGTMGKTQSRWSFESIHRISQKKGVFVDVVWGWGHDRAYEGWYMGGDIGYNLVASDSKAHWLSLMLRYDWTLGESFSETGRISVNLIYNLRGYFSD